MRDEHLRTLSPNPERRAARAVDSSRGFSLIELIMVVAIALVMLKISLPMMNTIISNMHLGATASSLASGIQSARYNAISAGCPTSITVSSGSYQVSAQAISGNPPTCSMNGVAILTIPYATSDISLVTSTSFVLNPNGTVTATVASTVPLNVSLVLAQSNSTLTKTVTVSGVGNVKVTAP